MGRKLVAISLATVTLGLLAWGYLWDRQTPVGAGPSLAQPEPVSATERILTVGRTGALSAVDPRTEEVLYRARRGVVSPTSDRVYSQGPRRVTATNSATGRPVERLDAPTGLELKVASESGRLLAFAPPDKPGGTEWMPAGRARTTIKVVGPGKSPRTYDLKGNYGIEAFSVDDSQLFLIKYMPAMNPWHYSLRRLVLTDGEVREIERSKQNAPGEMNGTGRLSLFSPAGHELYTLYTQQGPNYVHVAPEDAGPDEVYAFVHLLNLEGAWTHCIDLPAPFGTGAATTHAMTVSEDGGRLYVADPSSGGVAAIDPSAGRVLKMVTADLQALRRGASASTSSDGTLYLAGHHEVLVFHGTSLRLLRTFPVEAAISGIAVSADGSRLYAGTKGKILVLDTATGDRLDAIPTRGARAVVGST